MKISLTTHGGWGGRFATPLSIDTTALPAALAHEAARLAAAAEAAHAPDAAAAAGRARAPEAQSYTITVEHGDRSVTLKASDVGADPHLNALVDWVKRQA